MKKIKNYLIVVLLLFSNLHGFCQTQTTDKLIKSSVAVPPDAAAFQKYSYYPVSPSTGTTNVSIPLLSIKNGELQESISLDYHTGGIKVNERATKQGLGWLLNAGGMINRSVQGAQADETPNGYLSKKGLLPSPNDPNLTVAVSRSTPSKEFNDLCYSTITNPNIRNRIDLEPDLFSYKFGNKSGVFYFTTSGEIVNEGLDPLKIEAIDNLNSFKITDEDGVQYIFGLYQTSVNNSTTHLIDGRTYSQSGSGQDMLQEISSIIFSPPDKNIFETKTGWNLTQIIHPNQTDIIYFDYTSVPYQVYNKIGEEYQHPYNAFQVLTGDVLGYSLKGGIFETYSYADEVENILTRIRYGGNKIEFNYLADRQDKYVANKRLASIVSKDAFDNILQTISLDNNSYFLSNRGRVSYGSTDTFEDKRLKLKGVVFKDGAGVKQYAYNFKYNETYLPIINATAQDFWGFYNGEDGNQSLIPKIRVPFQAMGPSSLFIGNANRNASESYMKAFMLEEVSYPTGGLTRFEYSSHKISRQPSSYLDKYTKSIGGLKVDRILLYPDSNNLDAYQVKHYVYSYNDEKDRGRLISNESFEYNLSFNQNDFWGKRVNYLMVNSSPINNKDIPGYSTVEYDKVTEYDENKYAHINGYKVYSYIRAGEPTYFYKVGGTLPLNGPFAEGTSGYSPADFGGFMYDVNDPKSANLMNTIRLCPMKTFYPISSRPLLSSESMFNKDGFLLNQVSKNYVVRTENSKVVTGFSVSDMSTFMDTPGELMGEQGGNYHTPLGQLYIPSKYKAFLYTIPIGTNNVSDEITTDYDLKSSTYISKTVHYDYEPKYGFLRQSIAMNSKGNSIITEKWYPFDYNLSIPQIDSLTNKHILSVPILVQSKSNGKTLSGEINQYNGIGQLVASYNFNQTTNLIQQDPSVILPTLGFEKEYDLRYANGRLSSAIKRGAIKTNYLWGYGNQYPIAEIKNSDYSTIQNLLGGAAGVTTFANKPAPSSTEISAYLAPLYANLTSAFITNSTYKPLVGMLNKTDEKGQKTQFEYTSFAQLKNILDENGSIRKNFVYHYTNKVANPPVVDPGSYFYNDEKSAVFNRSNCGSGFIGGPITYTVPSGRYKSLISKQAANALAQADIDQNGQSYTNINGSCKIAGAFYNTIASQEFTRNDCGAGKYGSKVTYWVPPDTFFSMISQQDADLKAQNKIALIGQGYANLNGDCTDLGVRLVNNSYSSEVMGVHLFGLEEMITGQFPTGHGGTTILPTFSSGTYKIVCQSQTNKRFRIQGQTDQVGTSVTFNNVFIPEIGIVITVEEP